MASQQQKQQQQQQLPQQEYQRPASPPMTTSKSFDTTLMKTMDEESGRQAEKMSHLANAIQQQQQHITSTTTTGISFIANGLQMQIINQQSSTTTVYPPVPPLPPAPATPLSDPISSSNQQSENDLSIEVRSLQMKYLDDDQLAIATDYDQQSPTSSSIAQSPQIFDKNMSFATQKYFQKYNILSGSNRQQQCYLSSDENDLFISSSPPHQRMLLPLPQPSPPPPAFTQPPIPHAPQAKILDLSQIRKLPKLL